MNSENTTGHVHVTFSGTNTGQFVAGHRNSVTWQQTAQHGPTTEADLATLHAAVEEIRGRLNAEQLDAATTAKAKDKLDELEEAVTATEPDLSTMEHVRNWFGKNLPRLAGLVAGIVIHPVVGQLAQSAGDAIAAEYYRRFTPE